MSSTAIITSGNVTATSGNAQLRGSCFIPACKGNLAVITTAIFFDGTMNNRENANGLNPDISYQNDESNIAKGIKYYTGSLNGNDNKNLVIYVEGTGTEDHERDHLIDAALGTGDTGIRARVKEGMYRLADTILQEIDPSTNILEITLDVFGFSRGATNARHFLHLNSEPFKAVSSITGNPKTYLNCIEYVLNKKRSGGQHSSNNNNAKELKITSMSWRFAGLYETVSSYGIIHSNDVSSLGLRITVPIQKVLQLVAEDEYRSNFSLTTIDSAGSSGQTITLPGVHSDIGGGYVNLDPEKERTVYKITSKNRKKAEKKVIAVRDWFLNQGWYRKQFKNNSDKLEIKLRIKRDNSKKPPRAEYIYSLQAAREKVFNTYSYIPLYIMTKTAINEGVNFDLKKLEQNSPIKSDAFLKKIFDRLTKGLSIHGSDLIRLRYEYLHWSSYYNIANSPRFSPNDNTKYERRFFEG